MSYHILCIPDRIFAHFPIANEKRKSSPTWKCFPMLDGTDKNDPFHKFKPL